MSLIVFIPFLKEGVLEEIIKDYFFIKNFLNL